MGALLDTPVDSELYFGAIWIVQVEIPNQHGPMLDFHLLFPRENPQLPGRNKLKEI
jgi:hypothetical protein